jgi:hypothetical protein
MTVATKSIWRWTLAAMAGTVAAYAGVAATAWWRYGSSRASAGADADPLLDRFIPVFDVVERHHITVNAPASVTLQAAGDMDFEQSNLTKAIFRARALVLGSAPADPLRPRGLLAMTRSLGWGTLHEVPGREIVMGAVTKPWQSDVVFRPLPPDQFKAFNDPDFVKIVWTLRADPVGDSKSVFRTETRAVATDEQARRQFRRYWALVSPGIFVIRLLSLMPLKAEAERRVRAA